MPDPTPSPNLDPSLSPPEATPSPTPPRSPNGGAPAASAPSSRASSAGRFTVDAGPAFDAGDRPEPPDTQPPLEPGSELAVVELWDERRVRQLLTAKGAIVHHLAAVDPQSTEWSYTQRDLETIAPPLTAILNRYDATRAAAAAGDEMALAIGLGGYVVRSVGERRHAIARLREQPDVPVTGVAAEAGTGPEDDPGFVVVGDEDYDPAPIPPRRR